MILLKKNIIFLVLALCCLGVILSVILNNDSSNAEQNEIKGPSVTRDVAVQTAKDFFQLIEVEKVELRHLTTEELKQMPMEAKDKTPIYYIVKGKDQTGSKVTVYVSSDNENHHFKN
ncbi:hypothetical protein CIG75_02295 [Tumebacillus algifaecis]|uniref:Uncharacterized protein n=2 Tax=Tumebacillus algifaecis TaxID=1214604 RepID=A0A223CX96_9BACL|nr:hypothetical protein CIG75_02295 [Tumebacillus algifaecis]